MTSTKELLRRVILGALLLSGAGLLSSGVILDRAAVAAAGVGAWVLLLMALIWGTRYRLEQVRHAHDLAREDLRLVRRSQLSMHERLSTRIRNQGAQLERIRSSQVKLHSRIASQGVSTSRQHSMIIEELRIALERIRQAGTSERAAFAQVYRDAITDWVRVEGIVQQQADQLAAHRDTEAQIIDELRQVSNSIQKLSSPSPGPHSNDATQP